MTKVGGIAADHLNQIIERVEKLEQEKAQIAEYIREVMAEAKHNGFDVKTIRQILKLRKMDKDERDEREHLLELYKSALGMRPHFDESEISEAEAA